MSGWAMAAQAGLELMDTGIQTGMGIWSSNQARAEAAKNRQFQYDMFTNRYRLTMEDMRKAGLNPMLAYQQGGGNAPSGSALSAGNVAPKPGFKETLAKAKELELLDAQVANVKTDTAKKDSEFWLNTAIRNNYWKQTEILNWEEQNAKAAAAAAAHAEQFYKTDIGKWLRNIGIVGRELNPFLPSTSVHSGTSTVRSLRK